MCHCNMEFQPGDNVEIPDGSIGIVKRCDTEYMEPLYEIESSYTFFINNSPVPWRQKQWFLGKDLKLVSTKTINKECLACHGTGKILLLNNYVKCKEC